jgi:hypothetical protein
VNAVLEDQAEAQAGKNPAATREADAGVPAPGTEVPSGSDVRPNIVSAETHSAAVDETGDAEYSGTIVEFHERLPNAYLITLDNGQVWLQTEPKQYPLRPGLDVRIYPTSWGDNYRLHGLGTGSHIQVRRVR